MNLYQVDIFRTRTYKDIYNEPCDCIYCKNFRVAFSSYAPKAYDFLKTIGLSPENALEVMETPYEKGMYHYRIFFSLDGTLNKDGICVYEEDAKIIFYISNSPKLLYNNTRMKEPCFIAEVLVDLPWAMEEKK